ncbi:ATP-binding protein [Caldalkalibacillus thermarum]|uniref:ATP-binding protein n=1 Tax=Caldalkalibacillus thermarum TaxID=296745 RepID=UPI001665A9C0|nr:ATP-binding protein [Caldalkalibacillus thermarum]
MTEAVTNALKHAGSCQVEMWQESATGAILFLVIDQGKGIQLKHLPQVALVRGFSTRSSLGMGFHVMSQYTDKLFLKSDRAGTVVGLYFYKTLGLTS